MAKRNSDDAIASLMHQMSAQQGYEQTMPTKDGGGRGARNTATTSTTTTTTTAPAATTTTTATITTTAMLQSARPACHRRLSELKNYPDQIHLAGSHSIWNPYVQPLPVVVTGSEGGSRPDHRAHNKYKYSNRNGHTSTDHTIPTNPQVEVIRRRAFEAFKQDCTEALQRAQTSWGLKLPIPSMLEKWHMDAKLVERQTQQATATATSDGAKEEGQQPRTPSGMVGTSTGEIYEAILQRLSLKSTTTGKQDYYVDPILLSKQASSLFRPVLEAEVQKAWAKRKVPVEKKQQSPSSNSFPPKFGRKAQSIQKALHRCICKALESFSHQLQQAVQQQIQQQLQTHHRKRPKIGWDAEREQYKVTFSGLSFSVHTAYYEKLQRLYDRTNQRLVLGNDDYDDYDDDNQGQLVSFEDALYCLLCRYDMLQGAGLQAGVPGSIMDVLLDHLDCRMECFASPLNGRYERFGSAFPDVDRPFGSLGSFFDLDESFFIRPGGGGCYQANPPFCEGLIDQLNQRIHHLLAHCSSSSVDDDAPLMFVVFVPAWKDSSKAYREGLLQNDYLTQHWLLPQGQHWYAEGTQHRRQGSFRVASFDTSVLVYQNEAATTKWPMSTRSSSTTTTTTLTKHQPQPLLWDDLKMAFCQDPGTMDKTTVAGSVDKKRLTTRKDPSSSTNKAKSNMSVHGAGTNSKNGVALENTGGGVVVAAAAGTKLSASGGASSKQRNSGRNKSKPKESTKRRRLFSNQEDESKAQLSLLDSLGLTSGGNVDETKNSAKVGVGVKGNQKNLTTTKRKKKKKSRSSY